MPSSEQDLFSSSTAHAPLPERMRPRTLQEFIGQEHILGSGRLLRRAIQADRLSSVIFSGPPGTGKTTLARVIANTTKRAFTSLNAVLGGVAEVRQAIEQAKETRSLYDRSTILFVDEVHRWNKSQQDALLPWVENGTVVLIGATTENPYFAVNSALVSRSRIFQMKPLIPRELERVARQALADPLRGYGSIDVDIEPAALEHLIAIADGDARTLLGALELAIETTPDQFPPPPGESIYIPLQAAEDSIQRKAVLYDREGDYHYDTISAFIKSLRGSDPDAALYWMSRMVYSGEDPRYILRRMLILACEDVGLADPHALEVVNAAGQAFERVGMPEGQYFLAHAALYLATAPKSNSALGFFDALKAVAQESQFDVPNHLKDDNRDKHGFGHGQGYAYPHSYREHWVAQEYLPQGLRGKVFYQPGKLGYEGSIYSDVHRRRELQLSVHTSSDYPEVLSYSPQNAGREAWIQRVLRGGAQHLQRIREVLFTQLNPARHDRILVLGRSTPILTGEALRRCPEGGTSVVPAGTQETELLQHMAGELPEEEQPLILDDGAALQETPPPYPADGILAINLLLSVRDKLELLQRVRGYAAPGGKLVLAEFYPAGGTRLSHLLPEDFTGAYPHIQQAVADTEEAVYHDSSDPKTAWSPHDLIDACAAAGWINPQQHQEVLSEPRIITAEIIEGWIGNAPGRFARHLATLLSAQDRGLLKDTLKQAFRDGNIAWQHCVVFLQAEAPAPA